MTGSRLTRQRAASTYYRLPPRPVRVGTVMPHARPRGAERAAAIAAEDAARAATHAVPHVQLGTLGTTMMFRERRVAPLADFQTDKPTPAGRKSSRAPIAGKLPRAAPRGS